MVPLCRHIMPSNQTCQSPAIGGTLFCRNHTKIHVLARRPVLSLYPGQQPPLPLVYPEDRAAIQYDLFLVNQALAEGAIDTRKANALTRNLHVCLANLNKGPLLETSQETTVQRIILTPEGEEIAPPREQLEAGEKPPLHHKACPCQRCAEQYRNAPPELHHAHCKCGLCQPVEDQLCDQREQPREAVCLDGKSREAACLDGQPRPEGQSQSRIARAEKLYSQELTRDPANKDFSLNDYLYGDEHAKYEAQYAARAAAAIREGIEPPPYEPFDPKKIVSEADQRYNAIMEQVEKNKKIGDEIWRRRFPEDAAQEDAKKLKEAELKAGEAELKGEKSSKKQEMPS